MSDFLNQLADQVSSQFSLGENNNTTLNSVIDGKSVPYGSLGDFANNIDKSQERRYVEEGYLRRDPYNTDPKAFEVLFQEPNATILIKKRMFSSVGNNFRPDFMDKDEVLYFKATKVLFQNKCRQIAALEKLGKIQKITAAVGNISDQLLPIIISLTDSLVSSTGGASSQDLYGTFGNPTGQTSDIASFGQVINQLRKLYAFSHSSQLTSWLTDPTNLFQSQLGAGTGVIELTSFSNLRTNTTTSLRQGGSFSFTMMDPYQSSIISEYDIELALSDATNAFYNSKTFQLGIQSADQVVNSNQAALNQLRSARGASTIQFEINPSTLLGKRVRAILTGLGLEIPFTYNSGGALGFTGLGGAGGGVNVPPDYLQGGSIAGEDGLSTINSLTLAANPTINALAPQSELSYFQNLVSAIFNRMALQANSQNAFQTNNQNTNYARRKMRANFSGQSIIQAMDTVHIYLNSKSRFDSKLSTGISNMFSGAGILQNLNNTVVNLNTALSNASALFGGSGGLQFQAEKSIYVGSDFPNYLWSLLRTQFITEQEGTHVFAGVVETVSDNWTEGRFTLNVAGKDNSYYFDQGKVNFSPGADNFNGSIFDPLTPFKTNFDTISSNYKDNTPELLDENKYLLSTSQDSSLVKFNLGPMSGQKATQNNMIHDHLIDHTSPEVINKIFYAPDGLVYKWKEGIGVFTYAGNSVELNSPIRTGAQNTFAEPFAGQDVMNVISLLITGLPYNFASYFKSVQNFGGFGDDPHSLQNSVYSFINSLKTGLSTNNALWGHFVPFKNLVVGEQAFIKTMTAQATATRQNNDLNNQLKQLADLNNKMYLAGAANVLSNDSQTNNPDFKNLQAQAQTLTQNITAAVQQIDQQNKSVNGNGNDTSYDNLLGLQTGDKKRSQSDSSLRKYLRRQVNSLTRRMSYDVRANVDKNLFIVDDSYDKDYDIAAFNQAFVSGGMKLYNNDFTSVRQKIENVAQLLDLEVFCDTQGHIRARPPQYNRMPSSVFYRMMFLKQNLNVQVFPQFMSDFFFDQIDTLKNKIEIVEDQIRLDCALLGKLKRLDNDTDAENFLKNSNATKNTASGFNFLSLPSSGNIVDIDILLDQGTANSSSFDNIRTQANSSTKNVFTNSQQYLTLLSVLGTKANAAAGYNVNNISALQSSQVVNTLISRIQLKSGQKLTVQDYIVANDAGIKGISVPSRQQVDIFKITQELTDLTSQRQQAIRLFYQTVKNAAEFKALDSSQARQTANALLLPGTFGNDQIPEIYEHMIEDEGYDDYGTTSGSRFVIRRGQIRNVNIAVNPPEHTAVEVKGVLIPQAPNALPDSLNAFPDNGNGLTTAFAIDYDMWRNYGYKEPAIINAPFLNDPVSQCAPYAAILLSRNRKNLLRGSMTISGNEFMQPGEVIYYQDRNLLFYVNSVQHQFDFGSGFTTHLELSYGHNPGEYIPTVMDVIGKLIYSNRDTSSIIVQRQDKSNNDINMGALIRDPNSNNQINNGDAQTATTDFSTANSKIINNILYSAAYMLNNNNSAGNNATVSLELRCYFDNTSGSVNSNLNSFRQQMITALTLGASGSSLPGYTTKSGAANNPTFPASMIKQIDINLDDASDGHSPSQKAMNASRRLTEQFSSAISNKSANLGGNQLRKTLLTYLVDCWLTIKINDNLPQTQTAKGS